MPRGQGYQGVPPGPLSAWLGVRGANEAADMQKLGFLAQLQQAEQARRTNEAFRRDRLAAQVEGRKETIASREDIAAQLRDAAAERDRLRATDAAALERQRAADREHILRLSAQLRPPRPEQPPAPVTPVRVVRGGREVMVDARTGTEIGDAPPRAGGSSGGQVTPEMAAKIVEDEGTKLLALIGTNPASAASLLSPINRGVEAAYGLADPKYKGPALTSQNSKQRLIFAVDQLVKSGRSSNEFLRRLESALGMGTVTTPENAREAIQEAINMTRGMAGMPPASPPPTPKAKSPSEMTNEELLKALSGG